MEATEITITHESSNGENGNYTTTVPKPLADFILSALIEWEKECLLTPKAYIEFLENSKKL